ncbi:MAG: 8-amino-7-oxononanoate synthase [Candidatus Omnitrophota bacterium]
MDSIKKILSLWEDYGLYPDIKTVSSPPVPVQIINGKKVISFCSNNYLGLASSDLLVKAAIKAAKEYGVGSSGSRLLSGNLAIFEKLERKVAEFKKSDDAMVFTAGYMANVGTISAVANLNNIAFLPRAKEKTVIFSDEFNHASIIDGCKLSKAKVVVYGHCDMRDLEKKLKKYSRTRKLIVTDGIFSMDGDIAPLDVIAGFAKKYKALTMVDDAHATGILGKTGSGTAEHFGLDNDIDIKMGTFSKAIGVLGGYIAGKKELIKYLRIGARSYVFATASSPVLIAAILAALEEIKNNSSPRKILLENARMLREGFKSRGFDILTSQSQIIPVLIKDEAKAIKAAGLLFQEGYFAPCVRWPAVEKKKARIRFTVMSLHTEAQIKSLLDVMEKIDNKLNITKS